MTDEAKTRKPFTYHDSPPAIERDGKLYPLSALPEQVRTALALKGLSATLSAADDAWTHFENLQSGKATVGKIKAAEKIDPWREAGAIYHAERTAKAAGIKNPPGKKFRDAPEFRTHLEAARAITSAWTKDQLVSAKKTPGVVAEHHALTGAQEDNSLFAAPATAEPEAAPELLAAD